MNSIGIICHILEQNGIYLHLYIIFYLGKIDSRTNMTSSIDTRSENPKRHKILRDAGNKLPNFILFVKQLSFHTYILSISSIII